MFSHTPDFRKACGGGHPAPLVNSNAHIVAARPSACIADRSFLFSSRHARGGDVFALHMLCSFPSSRVASVSPLPLFPSLRRAGGSTSVPRPTAKSPLWLLQNIRSARLTNVIRPSTDFFSSFSRAHPPPKEMVAAEWRNEASRGLSGTPTRDGRVMREERQPKMGAVAPLGSKPGLAIQALGTNNS